ncbi:MAG TPA: hypothetical protein DCP08_01790 [Chloroflexi bacterium]|nr:hypothetical protein [Chloroflexota bacterium]
MTVYKEIIPQVARHNPQGILLVITNPVDVLTYLTVKLSGRPPSRVIGSGTVFDSARFPYLLSQHCGVDPRNVHAYIIGEHGDSEVPVWSLANISSEHLEEYCLVCDRGCTRAEREEIFQRVPRAGSEIIRAQGCYLLRHRPGGYDHYGKHPAQPEERAARLQPLTGTVWAP